MGHQPGRKKMTSSQKQPARGEGLISHGSPFYGVTFLSLSSPFFVPIISVEELKILSLLKYLCAKEIAELQERLTFLLSISSHLFLSLCNLRQFLFHGIKLDFCVESVRLK